MSNTIRQMQSQRIVHAPRHIKKGNPRFAYYDVGRGLLRERIIGLVRNRSNLR